MKRVADGGRHGESEAALRATRHLFVNRDNLRAAIATLVNATLRMRDPLWWGNGTTCASVPTKQTRRCRTWLPASRTRLSP
ncbi:Tn3 family transposase [Streptosporangium sandarakinum]|uniref:Tn3 family transposase n=1 Tax=Streptosporangium sandarakinum TaxID=1260955 RepID=UPI0037AB1582